MIDPSMMTDPVSPPYAGQHGAARVWSEVVDHLWPWRRRSEGTQPLWWALTTVLLAAGVTILWGLSAAGQVGAWAVILGWTGWSLVEIVIRHFSKPYVKEGPWWKGRYRYASWMDLICYVSFKNLLIGALLFGALTTTGLMTVSA